MNNIAYNLLAFAVEFLKLFLTSKYILRFKIKSYKLLSLATIFVLFLVTTLCNFVDISEYSIIYGALSAMLLYFATSKIKFKLGYISLAYVSVCLVDMVFATVLMSVFNLNPQDIQNSLWMISLNSITLFLLFIVSIFMALSHKNRIIINLSAKQLIAFIILGVSAGIYISFFQLFQAEVNKILAQRIALIGLSLSIAIFIGVCATLIISDNENRHLKYQNEINLKFLQQQKEYYMMLLNKNEETKKFRHDISNHIYCMYTLFQNREYKKLDSYFMDISKSLKELKVNPISGNNLIDSIINDQLSKYRNIELHWNGRTPSDLIISDMVLCTIFSNLISNAFEAASETTNKNVYVNVKILSTNLYLTIINKYDKQPVCERTKLVSSKKGNGHGYGIENVIRCVNENNGSFEWYVEDNTFTVEIIFMDAIKIV